jgi:hypothetical protein
MEEVRRVGGEIPLAQRERIEGEGPYSARDSSRARLRGLHPYARRAQISHREEAHAASSARFPPSWPYDSVCIVANCQLFKTLVPCSVRYPLFAPFCVNFLAEANLLLGDELFEDGV